MPSKDWHERAALYCSIAAGAGSVASIAASQILLGAALVAMIAGRIRPRAPAGWPWLAVFALWTLIALAASDAPRAGIPQVKKFYAWLILIVAASTFRRARHARWLAWAWLAGGAMSALWGCWQFVVKYRVAAQSGADFYLSYVAARITGFNSHWMTFSGQLMIALMAGLALVLFARPAGRRVALAWACLGVMTIALLLAWTRGVWIGTAVGAFYLLWRWRRWAVTMLPVTALAVLAAGPAGLRERALSLVRPHGATDSNLHRVYTWRAGIGMIQAHPWLGLGPERVGPHFREYIPSGLPAELPPGYYGHLHNIYLHWAAERGVPAAIAVMAFFLIQLVKRFRRLKVCPEDEQWLQHAGIAVISAVLVTGLFEYNLGDSEVLEMTLAWVAASDAVGASPPAAQS